MGNCCGGGKAPRPNEKPNTLEAKNRPQAGTDEENKEGAQ